MTTRRYRKRGAHAAPRRQAYPTRKQQEARDCRDEAERERRALAELHAREAGTLAPSTSVIETWFCSATTCREWTRPSLSKDGASCHRCGAPRPTPTP